MLTGRLVFVSNSQLIQKLFCCDLHK